MVTRRDFLKTTGTILTGLATMNCGVTYIVKQDKTSEKSLTDIMQDFEQKMDEYQSLELTAYKSETSTKKPLTKEMATNILNKLSQYDKSNLKNINPIDRTEIIITTDELIKEFNKYNNTWEEIITAKELGNESKIIENYILLNETKNSMFILQRMLYRNLDSFKSNFLTF
ncbi:MAG: hypothetical protein KKF65_04085 [Nanoarchaeota archaeon]|nr:hypothetical protein [Nanoarchaeota archaeon]